MDAELGQQVAANLSAIHRTLDVLVTVGDLESAASIAKTLGEVWWRHRHTDDGIHYLSTILNAPGSDGLPDDVLVTLYEHYGMLASGQCRFEQAEASYQTALTKRVGNPRTVLHLLSSIGTTAYQRGQYERAVDYYNKALALAEQLDSTEDIVFIYEMLGTMAGMQGSIKESLDRLTYAKAFSEKRGYQFGVAQCFNALGELERGRHNYRQAIDHYQASAALFEATRPDYGMVANGNLAFALLAAGEAAKAEPLFVRAYRQWEADQAPYRSALCLVGLAGVRASTQAYQQAARFLSAANHRFARSDGSFELADRLEYERVETIIRAHVSEDELRSIEERVTREEYNGRAPGLVHRMEMAALAGEAAALSSRELEMLRLISQGLTDKQIATRCYISLHTVNSHMRAVYRKLQVNNRSAALHIAHRQGLL
jgi:DNA-binding CsgD family transcriptional regulator/Tfp pilus assembly protein PilF